MKTTIIMHIDVNSAYLSWEAVKFLNNGTKLDLRTIPAVVGGSPKKRQGIVLAKSIPAKLYNIKTGETLYSALQKCPQLTVVPPSYRYYLEQSRQLKKFLEIYSPRVEPFSVDEFFVDFSGCSRCYGQPLMFAYELKYNILKEFGFTVNIGLSSNKLLAKIAGDFEKPNKVHSLFLDEINDKLWPLPIEDLFMVGRNTAPRMRALGIDTIGDLAAADRDFIAYKFKKFGLLLHDFAHGISHSLEKPEYSSAKAIGNSTTTSRDLTSREEIEMLILSLTEMISYRLRQVQKKGDVVSLSLKDKDFKHYSHQKKMAFCTDSTDKIYIVAKELLRDCWDKTPLRHIGVRISNLSSKDSQATTLLETKITKINKIDQTIDNIRQHFGQTAIMRACFAQSEFEAMKGGTENIIDYPALNSQL